MLFRMNTNPATETRKRKSIALGLGMAMLFGACGSSSDEASEDHGASELDRVSEQAAEALEKAENAEHAISKLEREIEQLAEGVPVLAFEDHEAEAAEEDAHAAPEEEAPEEEHAAPHWGYEGAIGADMWSSLSEDFAVCESGVQQSPIDIATGSTFVVGLDNPQLNWTASSLEVIDNGHTVQANVSAGSTTVFDGSTYDLLQFHFHRPSEHTVDGEAFPMELHFVHADAAGNLAVLGVLLNVGEEENAAFSSIWAAQAGDQPAIEEFDLTTLLPENLSRYRYSGSLTTPPCSEGVNWNVLAAPVSLSQAQVDTFLYNGNARPVESLGSRSVLSDES